MTKPEAASTAHGTLAPEAVLLDNRATPCAVGLIRAARRMSEIPAGTALEIWSRDHFAPVEIPLWAERGGHRVRTSGQLGSRFRRYHVFVIDA